MVFSSNGSSDPDGRIVGYAWNFGDGGSSTVANPSHTYAGGTYIATLTVTDDRGATASRSVTVQATAPPPPTPLSMSVSRIDMEVVKYLSAWVGKAYVTVLDASGQPVPNTIVSGRWFGLVNGSYVSAMTDAQGRAHHANYLIWFEMGRVELLRACGYSYKRLEEEGVLMVVIDVSCRYHRPAEYDDLLRLQTTTVRARGVRIDHEYRLYRGQTLMAEGRSTLACIDRQGKVRGIPEWLEMNEKTE